MGLSKIKTTETYSLKYYSIGLRENDEMKSSTMG